MFWLNFYQIAYIAKLGFFLAMPPSFSSSARAESKIESGILTNILPFNSFVKSESISELK